MFRRIRNFKHFPRPCGGDQILTLKLKRKCVKFGNDSDQWLQSSRVNKHGCDFKQKQVFATKVAKCPPQMSKFILS